MSFLPRCTGYLFLILITVSVSMNGAGAVPAICCAAQAVLLVLAQRRSGGRAWILPIQLLVTYLPFALSTGAVNLDGLLAATVLWCLPLRWARFGFLLVVAVSGGIHGGRHDYLYAAVTTAAIGLVVYVLLRLPILIDELRSSRHELAELTLARERLEATQRLRAALGDRLTSVIDLLQRARAAADPLRARDAVGAAASATREIIGTVRQTAIRQGALTRLPPDSATSRLAPQLTLVALVVGLAGWTVIEAVEIGRPYWPTVLGGATMSILLLGQLFWPRWARRLLLVQAAATLAPLPWVGSWSVWLMLLAVSALLSLSGMRAAIAVAGLFALRAAYSVPTSGLSGHGNWIIPAAEATLVLYGLARFRQLSVRLNEARAALVRMTLQVERLRIARDIHDLLGLTLSVLALKSDLVAELVVRDQDRAIAELDQALRIAANARTEAIALVDDNTARSLRHELRLAAQALAAACGDVDVAYDEDLPERAGAVLAPVVREAVTNVLRHSAATRVAIECRRHDGQLRLRIHNNGATGEPDSDGQGLRNMRARVTGAGGSFAASGTGDEFLLTALIPC
ncbi:sensor histidine kinase [Nocardia arthritidis]|uniref:Signal transduction histidine kinase subgroup 3 dimerisation and phosphoacceptor domain-containing protein n=1 Tax=Nocardia arthritidis TaxID=228602 RepID=A0A6G9Y9F9_9NOCA|nr:histidine kinase [Nocardia arthritidis]QIS09683.1 hypothetical protein F5544_08910 [Nocardia arthritidis]